MQLFSRYFAILFENVKKKNLRNVVFYTFINYLRFIGLRYNFHCFVISTFFAKTNFNTITKEIQNLQSLKWPRHGLPLEIIQEIASFTTIDDMYCWRKTCKVHNYAIDQFYRLRYHRNDTIQFILSKLIRTLCELRENDSMLSLWYDLPNAKLWDDTINGHFCHSQIMIFIFRLRHVIRCIDDKWDNSQQKILKQSMHINQKIQNIEKIWNLGLNLRKKWDLWYFKLITSECHSINNYLQLHQLFQFRIFLESFVQKLMQNENNCVGYEIIAMQSIWHRYLTNKQKQIYPSYDLVQNTDLFLETISQCLTSKNTTDSVFFKLTFYFLCFILLIQFVYPFF